MGTENKEVKTPEMEEQKLLKSISDLLDETIKEVETLAKGEVNFSDLKVQPDEQGDMPKEAKQPSDDLQGLKKEDEKLPEELKDKVEDKKEEKEEEKKEDVDKAIPAELSEAKEEEPKKDEEESKDEDEDEKDMEKFVRMLNKAMLRLGYIEKSEEAPAEEAKLEKSEEPVKEVEEPKKEEESLLKSELKARDEKIDALQKTVDSLSKTIEELSARPASRKSLSGLTAIAKSEEDLNGRSLAKGQVIDKLLDMQKSGDKRVTPMLVTKFEQTGDMSLVKELVK